MALATPGGNLPPIPISYSPVLPRDWNPQQCSACGALVIQEGAQEHSEWHGELRTVLQRLWDGR